jgi:DnaA N-terminal domain
VSRQAIAAALAREDLSAGERLVAFSLASFADRENRAWPGAPAAAARAGLRRSRYLEAREQLVRRGLVIVEDAATGRGRSSTLALRFADEGPWFEGELNAALFEAVLSHSCARGPARLLLAAMAALAGSDGIVEDLSTGYLCAAAGVADRTYRRARQALLASGELILLSGVGGRGNTNRWRIQDPRLLGGESRRPLSGQRVAPPAGVRPLLVSLDELPADEARTRDLAADCGVGELNESEAGGAVKGGHDRTLSPVNRPILTGVSGVKGGQDQTLLPVNRPILTGVSDVKGGQDQTLFALGEAETPAERAAETPAKTPAPYVRAGKEPQNPRTKEHPPNPPEGVRSQNSITIEETYTTTRGRTRSRPVNVNLDEVRRALGIPGPSDFADWARIREVLAQTVSEDTFAVWIEPVKLIAIDQHGALVLDAPPDLRSWLSGRFARLVERAAESAGRATRIADVAQSAAMSAS